MPTGYTEPIYRGDKDFTFESFTMRCARNFGACIELREQSLDTEIDLEKHFQPSDYHKKELERVEKEYQDFLNNPPTEENLSREYDKKLEESRKEFLQSKERSEAMQVRYAAILQKAEAWQPPTPEHQNLKKFMIQQLRDSMDWDCHLYEPRTESREEYIKAYISPDYLLKEIAYHREEYEKEVRLCSERKQWVIDLMNSLKEEGQ